MCYLGVSIWYRFYITLFLEVNPDAIDQPDNFDQLDNFSYNFVNFRNFLTKLSQNILYTIYD